MPKSQNSHTVSGHHVRRRLAGLAAATLAVVCSMAAMAPPSSAAGILPTTTTIASSSAFVATGQTVALTSTVKVLGLPGLGILPTGNVTFSSPGAVSTTAPLGFCLLTVCTAKGSITLPVAGARTVTATYNGNLLANVSSRTTVVEVYTPAPGAFSSDSETCPASQAFCTAYASTGSDCTADIPEDCVRLDVTDVRSSTARTVDAALVTGNEPNCPDSAAPPGTPWALFSSTSLDARKFVEMHFYGPQATTLAPLDGFGDLSYIWYGCFTSTKPFNGYVGGGNNHNAGTLQAAPLVSGFYQAKLPKCVGEPYLNPDLSPGDIDGLDGSSPVPCVFLKYEDGFFGTRLDISIVTLPGDPKYIPS